MKHYDSINDFESDNAPIGGDDFTNFCFDGEVEIETESIWARVKVVVIDGEIDEIGPQDLNIEILELAPLNRDGSALKHFFDGSDWLCKYIFFNHKDDLIYRTKVLAWESLKTKL